MEGLVLLIALVLLSIPIMLIVTLVKVCGLENQVATLMEKFNAANPPRPTGVPVVSSKNNLGNKEQHAAEVVQKDATVPAGELARAPQKVVPSCSSCLQPNHVEPPPAAKPLVPEVPAAPKYEPTAIEIFWMRIEDWLAVRGDFAPKGMTHEFAFATRWLVRIGVVLVLGAIVYFVKLSIDRGWMGPTGRVAATLFWGMVGCVGGTWLVKKGKYAPIGHAVAALGVAALYLGFGLDHRFFDPPVIASPVFAFAALAAVTVFAGVMAVYLPSPFIAVMGLVGGYLVPIVAGRDSGFPLGLDLYLVVLNLGAFYVARKRLWSALDFLASMLAVAVCCVWSASHADFGGRSAVLVNLAFLSVVHALYMTGVMVGAKARGKVGNAIAWAGLCVNACAYFAWLAIVFGDSFSSSCAGLILLALVAAYLAVATLAIRRGWADRATVNILLAFALVFLSIAPLLLFDHPWCIVSWAALAVAASEAEARSGERILGYLAYLVLGAAAIGGLFYYAPLAYCDRSVYELKALSAGEYIKELLLRLGRLWSLPVAAALTARRVRAKWLGIAALAVAFLFFTGEARIFGYAFFPALKTGTVSVAWLLVAFAGLWVGIARRSRATRITALSLLGVSVVKVLLMDTERLATPARVGVFALAGVLLIIGAFLYMKFKERFEE